MTDESALKAPMPFLREAIATAAVLDTPERVPSAHPLLCERSAADIPGIDAVWMGEAEASRGMLSLEPTCRESLRRVSRIPRSFSGERSAVLNARSLARGVRMDGFAPAYTDEYLAGPNAVGALAVSPRAPLSLTVLDRRIVLVGTGRNDPALIVATDRSVVRSANRYLDRLAEISVPIQPSWRSKAIAPTYRQLRIMALLAQGAGDESVARVLGITSRTVRADVAELAAAFGTRSRLELGVAWARWLDGR
ncbi:LuxR C-terminal-related transcriptional regulator [Luteipulveratus sp. YIM 133132]|uniref:helix-turn-helix transcriptional regulator n=1 Tax=Luteipulveratus flavus TaxID=3031728 RepID=UPI0023AF9D45|nr:LuxR C-terminal-related transcriptional regulator [Luteipulveratus sp. YIM 133132]MDE9366061.1 LuxR C-terminal-related transcriptional regulator [Luteipulveratus sp. YIM 133132]